MGRLTTTIDASRMSLRNLAFRRGINSSAVYLRSPQSFNLMKAIPLFSPEPTKLSKWGMAALGAGIGSAAVAAALLYANRNKKRG